MRMVCFNTSLKDTAAPGSPLGNSHTLCLLSHLNCPLAPAFLSQVSGATFHGNDSPGQWEEHGLRGQEMQVLLLALWSNWATRASHSVPTSVTSPVKWSESHQPSLMGWLWETQETHFLITALISLKPHRLVTATIFTEDIWLISPHLLLWTPWDPCRGYFHFCHWGNRLVFNVAKGT